MPEPTEPGPLPQATVDPPKRRRLSVIWIIPILAAVVAIGSTVQRILTEGPTITVVFKSAEGIEAGKVILPIPVRARGAWRTQRRRAASRARR